MGPAAAAAGLEVGLDAAMLGSEGGECERTGDSLGGGRTGESALVVGEGVRMEPADDGELRE
jgi:hypothetical protein